jgi:hypothetical protein
METKTVLKIIAMLDARIDHYEQLEYLDDDQFGAQWELINFRNDLKEYIKQQDKPGCDYCKSIGRDCYCCAADE